MRVAQSCPENVSLFASGTSQSIARFSQSIACLGETYGNFGLNGSLPWLQNTDVVICFICKEDIESVTHLFLDCSYSRNNFESLWNKLKFKIAGSNRTNGAHIFNLIENLDGRNKVLLLSGGTCSSLQ